MIHAQKRENLNYGSGLNDNSACFYMNIVHNWKTAGIRIYNNLCQGAEDEGFAIPHIDCDYLDNQVFF